MKRVAILVILSLMMCVACKSKPTDVTEEENVTGRTKTIVWEEPKESKVGQNKKYTALIKTSKGDVTVELYPKEAPLSVTNFKYLADNGFYNGLTFHRVVPDFVIQGGDPTGTGAGGPGYTIPAEINNERKHIKGALAWARQGDEVNPERRSSGSQFYITLVPTPFLDGGYTVFGQTTGGLDVVEKIQVGDTIESVEVREE